MAIPDQRVPTKSHKPWVVVCPDMVGQAGAQNVEPERCKSSTSTSIDHTNEGRNLPNATQWTRPRKPPGVQAEGALLALRWAPVALGSVLCVKWGWWDRMTRLRLPLV